MVHTVVICCQNLDKDLNKYEIKQVWSKFNFISYIMGIYVLHIMFGKGNCLTVSKLHTSCFY